MAWLTPFFEEDLDPGMIWAGEDFLWDSGFDNPALIHKRPPCTKKWPRFLFVTICKKIACLAHRLTFNPAATHS